jgi:homopolymeric O-antigen transport system permease protein
MAVPVDVAAQSAEDESDLSHHLDPSRRLIRIAPAARWPTINLRELWSYRGLCAFLVWRDIKSRYSQTVLGAGWAVLQPLFSMAVFTVIFGRFVRVPSDGVPYAVFSLTALVPWTYFASALTLSSDSLVTHRNLVTKVYFPRLVIPTTPILAALVDLSVALCVLIVVMLAFGVTPRPAAVLLLPILTLIMALTAAGAGYCLSALYIQYRDVRHVTPFLVQVWMYASPIVYSYSLVPPQYRLLYALNPMAGVITGFRAAMLGTGPFPWPLVGVSLAMAIVIFLGGALYFRRAERIFADVA